MIIIVFDEKVVCFIIKNDAHCTEELVTNYWKGAMKTNNSL